MPKYSIVEGFSNIRLNEFAVWAKVLKDLTPESALDFIQAVDDCLSIQEAASIHNRFAGKRKYNRKTARDLIYDRMHQVELTTRTIKKKKQNGRI